MFYKLLVYLVKISFEVGICCNMPARVGEEEVGHVRETRGQAFPQSLQLWVLLFLNSQLFSENIVPTLLPVRLFVRVLQEISSWYVISNIFYIPASLVQDIEASGMELVLSPQVQVFHIL